jgi:simple sugar transport system permease protein
MSKLHTEVTESEPQPRYAAVLGSLLRARAFGAIAVIVVLGAIFQGMSGNFLTGSELAGIFTVAAPLGITGAGVALLMISGEFDLSVGSMFAITPIVMGELIFKASWNIWPAFFVALLVPLTFGILHGLITTRAGIPSFIITLGSYFLLDGAAFVVTSGYPIVDLQRSTLFSLLGGSFGSSGFSAPMIWMVGITLCLAAVLNFTAFGNWSFAAGGRAGIGRALGVPIARVKTVNFCICALLAGFAGCTTFANVGSAAAGSGSTNNLLAIVAAVLGGTSLFGIEGSIIGTMFGAIILGMLETGLVLVGAPGDLYEAMIGAILIVAVLVNVRLNRFGIFLSRVGASR